MYVNGGVANLYGGFTIGKSGPSQGTVWQAAGQINLPANGDNMILGYNSGAVGSYYLNGGTLNTWDLRAGGNNDGVGGTGTITQTGGVANVNGWLHSAKGQARLVSIASAAARSTPTWNSGLAKRAAEP